MNPKKDRRDPGFLPCDPRDDAEALDDDRLLAWGSILNTASAYGWLNRNGHDAYAALRAEIDRRLTSGDIDSEDRP